MEMQILNTNLRDRIYDMLKDMILRKEIRTGNKINEEQLSKEYGVSRTPIREALLRLENEKIIKIIPRRGAFVVKPSQDSIRELFEIRIVLEELVTRLATSRMNVKILNKLLKCLENIQQVPDQEQYLMKYRQFSDQFHSILLETCGNGLLQDIMKTINSNMQIIRLRTVVIPGRAKKTVQEHYEIFKCIKKADEKEAGIMMRKHIESVYRDALRNIERIL